MAPSTTFVLRNTVHENLFLRVMWSSGQDAPALHITSPPHDRDRAFYTYTWGLCAESLSWPTGLLVSPWTGNTLNWSVPRNSVVSLLLLIRSRPLPEIILAHLSFCMSIYVWDSACQYLPKTPARVLVRITLNLWSNLGENWWYNFNV